MEDRGVLLQREGKTCVRASTVDISKCIICQEDKTLLPSGTERGRKRLMEAAEIRKDDVSKKIRSVDCNTFVYHVDNACYKTYTMKKSLEQLESNKEIFPLETDEDVPESSVQRQTRSSSTPRPLPTEKVIVKKHLCVICGHFKHQGTYEKFRISETDRANTFLKATVFFRDEVYDRTCDIQDASAVFGADLYCHKNCINSYLVKYRRAHQEMEVKVKTKTLEKRKCFENIIPTIDVGISDGKGYSLAEIRDYANEQMGDDVFTNNEIKILMMEYYQDSITFSIPKEANKSVLVFSRKITVQEVADKVRATDCIRESSEAIRSALLAYDFQLEDKFCDSNDLQDSWANIEIPQPLLSFFASLFNCKQSEFTELVTPFGNDNEDSDDEGTSEWVACSKRKKRVLTLFQIMHFMLSNGRKKTPLHVMLGQTVHDICKNSTLIKSLYHFGLSVSYDEVLWHHTDLATYTIDNSEEEVPFPSHFQPGSFTIAAFDNFDHNEATLSGIGGCHDTVAVLFQDKPEGRVPMKPKISQTNVQHGARSCTRKIPCQEVLEFLKPAKKPDIPNDYIVAPELFNMPEELRKKIQTKEVAWSLGRMNISAANVTTENSNQLMPSWIAFNSLVTTESITEKIVGFLPVIPEPVTNHSTVYTALKNFVSILRQLQQERLPVVCDEGVYHIAREILFLTGDEFNGIVLMLGSFHMIKVLLGCIGKYLRGSGAEDIWMETGIFGVNVTDSVLRGSNYARSLKGMLLLGEAMDRLRWQEFFRENDGQKFKEELQLLNELKKSVSLKQKPECLDILNRFEAIAKLMITDFQRIMTSKREKSETSHFWDHFIQMISVLKDMIRADREGNWNLHLSSVQRALPIFAAFDSYNYLRNCSVYLEDMRKLPEIAPYVYVQFLKGKASVKRSKSSFSAVGTDMALEQTINRSQKSSSGIIGSTRKKLFVAQWELVYHERLAISNLYREISGVRALSYELSLHKEFNKSTTEDDERRVNRMIHFIQSRENPFVIDEGTNKKLHHIVTQEILPLEVRQKLLRVEEIGSDSYLKFRQERLVDKSVRMAATIHRINIPNFDSLHNQRKPVDVKKKATKAAAGNHKIVDLARVRGYDMKELFKYDLSQSTYLFDECGQPTKAIKSSLVKELEKRLIQDDYINPAEWDKSLSTAVIVDVMANVRKMKAKNNTFGDLSDQFINYIFTVSRNADRIDFVFDTYVESSVKDTERMRRSKGKVIEINTVKSITPLPVQMETFWPSNNNKSQLQHLLKEKILLRGTDSPSNVKVFVSGMEEETLSPCKSTYQGNVAEHRELASCIEEADERIIVHAHHAVKDKARRIIVLSTDTDVFVLVLYYWWLLHEKGLKELWLRFGVGDTTRYIPVHALATILGDNFCKVLPAVHCLTGCDITSRFGTKAAALKAIL